MLIYSVNRVLENNFKFSAQPKKKKKNIEKLSPEEALMALAKENRENESDGRVVLTVYQKIDQGQYSADHKIELKAKLWQIITPKQQRALQLLLQAKSKA